MLVVIAAQTAYGMLFRTLVESSRQTGAVEFQGNKLGKNIANTIDRANGPIASSSRRCLQKPFDWSPSEWAELRRQLQQETVCQVLEKAEAESTVVLEDSLLQCHRKVWMSSAADKVGEVGQVPTSVADLRKMHQMDLEEIGSQMQVTLSEIERFQKLAVDREGRVKELQLRLVKRKEQRITKAGVPRPVGDRAEVVSEGGFSNLSDILDIKNALDFYVTTGHIEDVGWGERALLELPRQGAILSQVPPATSLVTLVLAEFMHCDVGSSETAGGLRPRYDSLLSFGPFEVGDAEVEHFAKGSLRLELQAFSSGGSAAYVLGRASLPLAALLDCTPQDPNPVVAGTLYFASEEDSRVQIAAVRYKARWRRSIIQELETYTLRRGVTPLAVAEAPIAPGAGGNQWDHQPFPSTSKWLPGLPLRAKPQSGHLCQ
eukprot:s75_g1.t1